MVGTLWLLVYLKHYYLTRCEFDEEIVMRIKVYPELEVGVLGDAVGNRTLRTRKANICTRLQVPASGAFYFGWVVNTGKGAVARWIPRLHSNTVP